MKITIYTTDTCAYCPMVKKYLDNKNIEYDVVNVTFDLKKANEVVQKSGAMTVPVTVRGDWESFVVGWQPGKLAQLIK